MTSLAQRYYELIMELRMARLKRELEGSELPLSEEADFIGELDLCWNQMSNEEQDAVELVLSHEPTSAAQKHFCSLDVNVEINSESAPRNPITMAA